MSDDAAADNRLFSRTTSVLKVATTFSAIFGFGFVAFNGLTSDFFDWMVYGSRKLEVPRGLVEDSRSRDYVKFVYGILGAVLGGWGMQMRMHLDTKAWRGRELAAWRGVAYPVFAWFVVDTSFSYLTGFLPNCVLNLGFFAALGVPLLMNRRLFSEKE